MPCLDRPGRNGFTLVEVLIAVALLGALAAVAIPRMETARYRSRRAEAQTNVRGVRAALLAAFASGDLPPFTGAGPAPRVDADLDSTAVPWVGDKGFELIGYEPDGKVWCNYTIDLSNTDDPYVRGACDVDDDDRISEVIMTGTQYPHLATPSDIY